MNKTVKDLKNEFSEPDNFPYLGEGKQGFEQFLNIKKIIEENKESGIKKKSLSKKNDSKDLKFEEKPINFDFKNITSTTNFENKNFIEKEKEENAHNLNKDDFNFNNNFFNDFQQNNDEEDKISGPQENYSNFPGNNESPSPLIVFKPNLI